MATRRPPGFSKRYLRQIRRGGRASAAAAANLNQIHLRLSEGDGAIFGVEGRLHVKGSVVRLGLEALHLHTCHNITY